MKPKTPTILIIEDDEASREFLSEVISIQGYEFILAGNGIDGIEQFTKHGADLILLDIRLPDISGIEVLKKLRKLSPSVPVIAQTAFAMEKDRDEFLKAGFDGYLSKPIKPDDLISAIETFLPS